MDRGGIDRKGLGNSATYGKVGHGQVAHRKSGPRSLAALLPPLVRPIFRHRSPASATLLSDWAAIVGPALAARTAPRHVRAGVLTLGCDGPTALELQHVEGKLIERINIELGAAVVRRIRLVQDGAPSTPPRRRLAAATPAPIEGLPGGALGDALARLGGAIARRRDGG